MDREPADPAEAEDDSSTDRKDAGLAGEDENPEQSLQDDGSVPEKQIQRWKDEGGALTGI